MQWTMNMKLILRSKSLCIITALLSVLFLLFILLYNWNIFFIKEHLHQLPQNMPVKVTVTNRNNSQQVGLEIDRERINMISSRNDIRDLNISLQTFGNPSNIPQTDEPLLSCQIIATNDLSLFTAFTAKDIYFDADEDLSFLNGDEPKCVVSRNYLDSLGQSVGNSIDMAIYTVTYEDANVYSSEFTTEKVGDIQMKIVGEYKSNYEGTTDIAPELICSAKWLEKYLYENRMPVHYSSCHFYLEDPSKMNELKAKAKEMGFTAVDTQSAYSRKGASMIFDDSLYIESATQLLDQIYTLEFFSPFIFVLVTILSFIISHISGLSKQRELSLMRSLGVPKLTCGLVISFSFLLISLVPMLLIFILILVFNNSFSLVSAQLILLYILAYSLGLLLNFPSFMAVSPMKLLTKRW